MTLLIFGATKLPEIGRSLGTEMREFKEAIGVSRPSEEPGMRKLEARSETESQRNGKQRRAATAARGKKSP